MKSRHVDFGMYGSDSRFVFTGDDGKVYIEKLDFDNGSCSGETVKKDGRLYFRFIPEQAAGCEGGVLV